MGVILALVISKVFKDVEKFKPSEAEVQVLNEDDQQLLSGTRSLEGLTPELLNDLIQENRIMWAPL